MPLPEGFQHSHEGYNPRPSTPPQATLLFNCIIGRDQFVKVYGKVHEDELVFCINLTVLEWDSADENILQTRQTQKWATTEEYEAHHVRLWEGGSMKVNPLFVVDAGTGDADDNTNELCERDGTLKIENIRARC